MMDLLNLKKTCVYKIIFAFFVCCNSFAVNAAEDIIITYDGLSMTTTSVEQESIAVFDNITLANEDVLMVSALFEGDLSTNNLEVFFDDQPIPVIVGLNGVEDDYGLMMLDISAYKGITGELQYKLTNSGAKDSELFLVSDVTLPAGVEFPAIGAESSGSGESGGSVSLLSFIILSSLFFNRLITRKISRT